MKILYFAWLRTRIGLGEEDVDPPSEVRTVGELIEWLKGRGPGYASAFAQASMVRAAVDQDYATPDRLLKSATEVAFFPPVTGGVGR
jgi:molybdopterin converting factor subunit 1